MDEPEDVLAEDEEITTAPLPDDPAALRQLAESYLDRDEPAAAVAVYTRLAELTPDDSDPWEGRAWAEIAAGQADAVRGTIAALLDRFPDHAGVAATVGELYAALGEQAEALHAFDRATALAGDDNDMLYRIARDFEQAEAPEPALALYARLISWRPREVLLARAGLHINRGEFAAALADLDAALAAPPSGTDRTYDNASTARVLLNRAQTHYNLRHLEAAEADARAGLDLAPIGPVAPLTWNVLAEVALARGDRAAARAAAEAALAQDPDLLPAWLAIINGYTAEHNMPAALEAAHRGLERLPTDPNLVLTAALIRGEMNDFAGAVAEWDRLLAVLPDNPTALAMRGAVYLQLGQAREARADVDRALQLDPANLTALQSRISIHVRANNLPAALADLNRALAAEPHDTDLLLLRAQLHLELGQPVAAAADYTEVLQIAPGNAAGLSGLGNVQMLTGQYEGALRSYEEALRAAPGAGAGYYNLAAAQAALGRCPQAVELLRRAVAADPSFAQAALEDEYLAACRDHPGFAAALRGGPATATTPRGKAKPPRRKR
jgi:tetratricopeptide (TPR) repeat protein